MRVPNEQPFVWHWHGFKPYDVQCWLRYLDSGAWDLEELTIRDGLQETKKGGCRGLLNPRMQMHECSLAAYLDLLAANERLLAIADAIYSDDGG